MRALLVIAVVVLLMAFAGWVRFYSSEDEAGVTVDTQEMREDVDRAGKSMEQTVEDLRDGRDGTDDPIDDSAGEEDNTLPPAPERVDDQPL